MSFASPDLTSILMATTYDSSAVASAQSAISYRLKMKSPLDDGTTSVSFQEAYEAVIALLLDGHKEDRSLSDLKAILNASVQKGLVSSPAFGLPLLKALGVKSDVLEGEGIDGAQARKFVLYLNLLLRSGYLAGAHEAEIMETSARRALYLIYSQIEYGPGSDEEKKATITRFLSQAIDTLPPSWFRDAKARFLTSITTPSNVEYERARFDRSGNRSQKMIAGAFAGWLLGPLTVLAHVVPTEYILLPGIGGAALGTLGGYFYHRRFSMPFVKDPRRLAAAVRHCRTALGE